jgi:hypothetical protein
MGLILSIPKTGNIMSCIRVKTKGVEIESKRLSQRRSRNTKEEGGMNG